MLCGPSELALLYFSTIVIGRIACMSLTVKIEKEERCYEPGFAVGYYDKEGKIVLRGKSTFQPALNAGRRLSVRYLQSASVDSINVPLALL
jgi:hypothetical protein